MSKPVTSFRIDPELLEKARAKGIDVTKLIEASLASALKIKKCPFCNQRIK